MKTKMTMICMLVMLICKSQLTLENTYPQTTYFGIANLGAGQKYYHVTGNGSSITINLYNINHSIFKATTINLTQFMNPSVSAIPMCSLISDSLFDKNPDIEFFIIVKPQNPGIPVYGYVFSETGAREDSILNCTSPAYAQKVGGAWKLIAYTLSGSNQSEQVYSLIGSMPAYTQPHKPSQPPVPTSTTQRLAKPQVSDPYPNPSAGKAIVGYELPEGKTTGTIVVYDIQGKPIKNYEVDATFNTLELDNTDLPSGTYFYQLQGTSTTRKMLIIK